MSRNQTQKIHNICLDFDAIHITSVLYNFSLILSIIFILSLSKGNLDLFCGDLLSSWSRINGSY